MQAPLWRGPSDAPTLSKCESVGVFRFLPARTRPAAGLHWLQPSHTIVAQLI